MVQERTEVAVLEIVDVVNPVLSAEVGTKETVEEMKVVVGTKETEKDLKVVADIEETETELKDRVEISEGIEKVEKVLIKVIAVRLTNDKMMVKKDLNVEILNIETEKGVEKTIELKDVLGQLRLKTRVKKDLNVNLDLE